MIITDGENAELFRNRKDYFSLNVQTVCNNNVASAKNFFVFFFSYPNSFSKLQNFDIHQNYYYSTITLLLNECSITFQHFSFARIHSPCT